MGCERDERWDRAGTVSGGKWGTEAEGQNRAAGLVWEAWHRGLASLTPVPSTHTDLTPPPPPSRSVSAVRPRPRHVQELQARMEKAAEDDESAARADPPQPAIHKVMMLAEVEAMMKKKQCALASACQTTTDNSALSAAWLRTGQPWHGRTQEPRSTYIHTYIHSNTPQHLEELCLDLS